MVAITEDDIRELAAFKGEEAPVTSCYLDVDGRHRIRRQDYEYELESLLRSARSHLNGAPSVADDLKRIEEYVRRGIDRSHVRGLALFSCSAHDFWRAIELPVPVRSQITVNHTPYVRQLELVLDEYDRFGLLLADKQRARMFVFELGEVVESDELFERLPRHDDDGGTWSKDHVQSHVAEHASQHLRHAAQVAFHVFQERGFDHLVLGAPDEIVGELEGLLHPYLQERVAARLSVPIGASIDEIRTAALEIEAEIECRREAEAVARLREAVGAQRRGVAGLAETLRALVERRVAMLLVSRGFQAPGWRCGACGWIGVRGRTCPVCETEMHRVDDVVEEAVEEAVTQSCTVEICHDNADLDVMGRIGALLRF